MPEVLRDGREMQKTSEFSSGQLTIQTDKKSHGAGSGMNTWWWRGKSETHKDCKNSQGKGDNSGQLVLQHLNLVHLLVIREAFYYIFLT